MGSEEGANELDWTRSWPYLYKGAGGEPYSFRGFQKARGGPENQAALN